MLKELNSFGLLWWGKTFDVFLPTRLRNKLNKTNKYVLVSKKSKGYYHTY